MSRYLIEKAERLVQWVDADPDVPTTLTEVFDIFVEDDRWLAKSFFEVAGEDFATWLILFNMVQERLLYRPEDFVENVQVALVRVQPPSPEYPQTPIKDELPACLDVFRWNASVERYRRNKALDVFDERKHVVR